MFKNHKKSSFALLVALLSLAPLAGTAEAQSFVSTPYSAPYGAAMPGEYQIHERDRSVAVHDMTTADPRWYSRPLAYRGGEGAVTDNSVIVYPLDGGQYFLNKTQPFRPGALPVDPVPMGAGAAYGELPAGAPPSPAAASYDEGDAMDQYVRRYYGLAQAQRQANAPQMEIPARTPSQGYGSGSAAANPAIVTSRGQERSMVASGYQPARIYFGHGSAALDRQDIDVIRSMARQIGNAPYGTRYVVAGHASRRAEAPSEKNKRINNLKVSVDRAYQVSRRLILEGVPAASIETVAYGDTQPASALSALGQEAASRRVEIYIQTGR